VRPTSAVLRYTNTTLDPVTIGRQQGVEAVLAGTVQREADRIRINAQLIRVADGAMLWSGHFDERVENVFSMQDTIAEQVSCDVITRICGREALQLVKQERTNIEAYDAYLNGRYFWNKRHGAGYAKAIEYFERAIKIDPNYARAYAGLADSYLLIGGSGLMPQSEAARKARAAAQTALVLDKNLAEPHASLGLLAMNYDWDWQTAEREYKQSIELNPHYVTAHHWYAEYLITQGRVDEALAEIELAQTLDPLSSIVNSDKGKILYYSRRYDEALTQLRKTVQLDPSFLAAHEWLFQVHCAQGHYDQSIAELRAHPDWPSAWLLAWSAYGLAAAGHKDEAAKVVGELRHFGNKSQLDPQSILPLYIGLGDKDHVFSLLEKEYEGRSPGLTSLRVNPLYDSLRSDPRFVEFMRRVGMSPESSVAMKK